MPDWGKLQLRSLDAKRIEDFPTVRTPRLLNSFESG
jgi:hypothetical protein